MRATSVALAAACLGVISAPAFAHFKLTSPSSATEQDGLTGDPQKSAPCGLSNDPNKADESTPTNVVSTLKAGSMVSITLTETITHPGHYRVALAQDPSGLPADPLVTPGGSPSSPCGTTIIDANPVLPLLADGQLKHTTSFGGKPQTIQVQLPPGMTCTNCVLQVVQFMSAHPLNNPGGCFYHHCARVNVTADGPQDAGVIAGDDAGTNPGGGGGGGCCDGAGHAGTSAFGVALVALVLAGQARRRRRG